MIGIVEHDDRFPDMKVIKIAKAYFAEIDQLLIARNYRAYRERCLALGIGPSLLDNTEDDILIVPAEEWEAS